MQGRKSTTSASIAHYNWHIQQGHFQEGEYPPLKVLIPHPGVNIEDEHEPLAMAEAIHGNRGSEAGDNEVEDSEDEEDGDRGDWGSESEDEVVENSEDVEYDPATELAAAWLDRFPKDQNILKKVARPEGSRHYGLKCPGPGRVADGLVLGTQVCPNRATISFETGVVVKRKESQHIGLKTRCASCHGRFMFNEFLRTHFLEADPDQEACSHKGCLKPAWEGSKLCHNHFLSWTPDLLSKDKVAMDELRNLFEKAAFDQWFPATTIMARVLERMESDSKTNIPASEIVNIDLETAFFSRKVLQIGLANLQGEKALDCLTKYGEGIIAPSKSGLSAQATQRQKDYEKKVRTYYSQDGTLDANRVVGKLREIGISKKTIFLSWATWCFDLSFLRDWLGAEGFHDVLPGDENVCLLLKEFRLNVSRVIGRTCYRGGGVPLSLPVLFLLLFGENHRLSGRNHHALVDAQQLSMIAEVFVDLCKPPDKRVLWRRSEITLGPGKRQRPLEVYSPRSNKKAKL
ncbi:hypothetical protein N7474_006525 [Penicillium riverlandense]|uniref:uncharacterized protein n=1 Tax=Penicillium riverlandense TaxID=1903569 RepID=UPI002546D412|nr:uncharacterized protein N7474_006525 [Penicillium riverlandense]KAJ5814748.1 hypothetical protein N7474_006525 [Penicillium riverlandense]